MGSYRFLEDIALADSAVEIAGRDLDDLFETAVEALARLMVDPATIAPSVDRRIDLQAAQLDLLLFDWLSELIFLKDRDRYVFTSSHVRIGGTGPFTLAAQLRGGVIDSERTALGADPKAVTLHRFALEQSEDGWRARVVIDI